MTHDALPFVVYAEEAALIDAHRYYSRDRRNAIDRLRKAAESSGVPAARRGDVGGYVAETTKHLEGE